MKSVSRIKTRSSWKLGCILLVSLAASAAFASEKTPAAPAEPWVVPPRAARKENPVPSNTATLAEGKEFFIAGCLPCHGPAGKGDGPASATLERDGKPIKPGNLSDPKLWEQPDGAIFWKLSEGKTPMPSFAEAFTEEQRWKIVNYVRTLSPKPQK
ncbi:MAG TPA: c-type cytochrome [Verrucomicrobiae bacterium]